MVGWKPKYATKWFILYEGVGYKESVANLILMKHQKRYPKFLFKLIPKE